MSERDQLEDSGSGATVAVTVVLDGPGVPAWQARVVELLDESHTVTIESLHLARRPERRIARTRDWRERLQRHVFAIHPDPCARVELTERGTWRASQLTLWLAEAQPPRTNGECLLVLRHGDLLETASGAFWRALLAGKSCVRSELVAVEADGAARTLTSTTSEIRPYSEAVSRALALWKLTALVVRTLERLPDADAHAPPTSEITPATGPPAPEWVLLFTTAVRAARAVLTRVCFRRPWSIALGPGDGGWPPSPANARPVSWPGAKTYADPYLFEHEGRHHLFCEEVPAGECDGVISHTEISPDGCVASPPTPVLRGPHHLSYPFVFAHNEEIFMIPETSAVERVELYRATAFPTDWRLEAVLLDGLRAADATLLEHNGLLWLFASVAAPGASTLDELHLFWARDLLGPWHPHAQNPIVSDVRCARPAGAIQHSGTQMIRPAQDCSRRYGWAISFRQIDVLSTSAYAEHEIGRVEPDAIKHARAIHTFNASDGLQAWDLRRREVRWWRRRDP